jgi:hypothetical protein
MTLSVGRINILSEPGKEYFVAPLPYYEEFYSIMNLIILPNSKFHFFENFRLIGLNVPLCKSNSVYNNFDTLTNLLSEFDFLFIKQVI